MTWCSGIAYNKIEDEGVMVMVFSATFNNISDISLRSVLLVEETGVSENTTDLCQVIDNFITYCCIEYTPP